MTESIYFVPNKPVLDYYLKNPAGPVGQDLARRSSKVMVAAKRQVGVKTGALRDSIHMRHEREITGQAMWIGSPLPYAKLHHEGSKPHVILPVQGKYLKFVSGRRLVFTTMVNHPGTRPNRYLSDNLKLILP